jgi:hypothetical protein
LFLSLGIINLRAKHYIVSRQNDQKTSIYRQSIYIKIAIHLSFDFIKWTIYYIQMLQNSGTNCRKYNPGNLILSLLLTLIAFYIITLCGCNGDGTNDMNRGASDSDSLVIVVKGQTGKSVLEILQEKHYLDFTAGPMGVFIRSIDSVEAKSGYIWVYTINDTMALIAADKYITVDSDIIKWHYRKYQD